MSIHVYGLRFTCDLCGVTADGPVPAEGPVLFAEQPVPDGWTALEPMLSLRLTDIYGAPIGHLCRTCSALPIGELAARLRAKVSETVAT